MGKYLWDYVNVTKCVMFLLQVKKFRVHLKLGCFRIPILPGELVDEANAQTDEDTALLGRDSTDATQEDTNFTIDNVIDQDVYWFATVRETKTILISKSKLSWNFTHLYTCLFGLICALCIFIFLYYCNTFFNVVRNTCSYLFLNVFRNKEIRLQQLHKEQSCFNSSWY